LPRGLATEIRLMTMTIDQILKRCSQTMDKTLEYLEREMRGIRTGRATSALIEFVKVDYYGNSTDLRDIAAISVPEATQLLVKPFDPSAKSDIIKAIEKAELGLNPISEGATIRIMVPAPSTERRKQLTGQVKKMGEDAKVAVRNERRDANKHIDQLLKDKATHTPEDAAKKGKDDVEQLTKKHVDKIDAATAKKIGEIEAV
jgi:ribosome recycling factor